MRRDGFGLIATLFVLLVLSLIVVFIVNIAGVQRSTVNHVIQSAKVLAGARSGVQWGVYRCVNDGACPATTTLTLTEGGLNGVSVEVSCTSTAVTEEVDDYNTYVLTAVAEYGTYGQSDYAKRRLEATINDAP